VDAFDEQDVENIKNGDVGEFIAVQNGKLKDGADKVFTTTARLQAGVDDQRGFGSIKQDMNETLGIGSNQAGVETDTVRTATEADRVASAMNARNDKELSRVVDLYLDLVRGVDQLLMRYMTQTEYVQIAGENAAQVMQAWNGKLITGKYLYDIAPDSQLRPDTAQRRQMTLQYYNLTAKDPLSNRPYILSMLAREFGFDPAKAIAPPPPPPQPKPEPTRFTLTVSVADLGNPNVMAFLQSLEGMPGGLETTIAVGGKQPMQPPGAAAGPIPPHGGALDRADVISEHLMSNSGGKPNAPGAHNHREQEVK
jgi:hypothetical protein